MRSNGTRNKKQRLTIRDMGEAKRREATRGVESGGEAAKCNERKKLKNRGERKDNSIR